VAGNQKFPIRDKQQRKVLVSSHAGCFQGSAGELSLSLQAGHNKTKREQKLGKAPKGLQEMQLDMQAKVLLGRAGDRVYSNLCLSREGRPATPRELRGKAICVETRYQTTYIKRLVRSR
jgi:hypothetical protein